MTKLLGGGADAITALGGAAAASSPGQLGLNLSNNVGLNGCRKQSMRPDICDEETREKGVRDCGRYSGRAPGALRSSHLLTRNGSAC